MQAWENDKSIVGIKAMLFTETSHCLNFLEAFCLEGQQNWLGFKGEAGNEVTMIGMLSGVRGNEVREVGSVGGGAG